METTAPGETASSPAGEVRGAAGSGRDRLRDEGLPRPLLPRTPRQAAAALETLRATLRGYHATCTPRGDGTYNFEVTRINDKGPGPMCLISRDPGEILGRLGVGQSASSSQDT